MKIALYAFANTAYFFQALIREAQQATEIEWQVILPRGHHRHLFKELLEDHNTFYLYQDFNREYAKTKPPFQFDFPDGADNVFLCLSKDKDGYQHLDKEEQLRRGATIYSLYRDFLITSRPDYVIFPDLETVDGFILINLCYELGIEPIYYVGTRNLGRSFFTHSPYEELPPYFGQYSAEALTAADEALALFRKGQLSAARFETPCNTSDAVKIEPPCLAMRAIDNVRVYRRYERLYKGEDNLIQKVKTNLKPLLKWYRKIRFSILQYRYFDICSMNDPLPKNFVLFALQYTPESSINGLEPYFVDQTRAIDLIRQSLPSGYSLLVKEHPAIAGVRSDSFYKVLRRMPGVELVHPDVPSQALVDKSKLVATITGTIGLECFLAGRPCLLFGRTFFKHLCYSYESYHDFRQELRKMLCDFQPPTVEEKRIALAKLFSISNQCCLGDPLAQPIVMHRENVRNFLAAVMRHISRLSESKNPPVSCDRTLLCP